MKVNIKTEYINPPIPIRTHDWVAYDKDDPESGCGFGRTEQEARDEFIELILEANLLEI